MAHIDVGVSGRGHRRYADAGVVEVRYSGGTVKALTAPAPQAGSWFGSAIAAYDYDNDERQDLFVGAPGRDIDGKVDAGEIYFQTMVQSGVETIVHQDSPACRERPKRATGSGAP